MSKYSVLRDKQAHKLIAKYGQAMTLERAVKGTYDPDTGITSADTTTTYNVTGFIQNIDSAAANQFYSTSTLQDTLIQKQDQMVMLSAKNMTVVPTPIIDTIIVASVRYAVIANIPLEPGGVVIFHTVQVRR